MNQPATSIALPTSLTIRNAADVAQSLQEHDPTHPLELDAGAVEEITSPGLQLLAACWHQAKQQELEFSLIRPSEALQNALGVAGLNYLLD